MNESWSAAAQLIGRYRGALLGGIGSAVAVAMTLDPSSGLASSSLRFTFWFAMAATALAVCLNGVLAIAQYRASVTRGPVLPKAIARRR